MRFLRQAQDERSESDLRFLIWLFSNPLDSGTDRNDGWGLTRQAFGEAEDRLGVAEEHFGQLLGAAGHHLVTGLNLQSLHTLEPLGDAQLEIGRDDPVLG